MKIGDIEIGASSNSSGTRGFFREGYWFHKLLKIIFFFGFLPELLTFTTKTFTWNDNKGNTPLSRKNWRPKSFFPSSIIVKWFHRTVLNAVGLTNWGIKAALETGRLQKLIGPIILSFMAIGKTKADRLEEMRQFVDYLKGELPKFKSYGKIILQINISCPNAGHNPLELANEAIELLKIASELGIPLDLKINVLVPIETVKKIEQSGLCNCITVTNTIPWLTVKEIPWKEIFGSLISPLSKKGFGNGGLSGWWVLPYLINWIYEARQAGITLSIKAGGGIFSRRDVLALKKAGANGIELGVGNFFFFPWKMKNIIKFATEIFKNAVHQITIPKPFNAHLHLRDGLMMMNVMIFTVYIYARAIIMGNLKPAIKNAEDALRYKKEIERHCPPQEINHFTPEMTVMLLNGTTYETLSEAYKTGFRIIKLIPGGASTNSEEGVSLEGLQTFYPMLNRLAEEQIPNREVVFSLHLELSIDPITNQEIPYEEREERAIPYLYDLVRNVPNIKIVVEHVTTRKMIEAIEALVKKGYKIAGTFTAHHFYLTIDDVMKNGKINNPDNFCLPVAKTEDDRKAIIERATSGEPYWFFGGDSAPHYASKKVFGINPPENRQPPAGIFSEPTALVSILEKFEEKEAIKNYGYFVSVAGPLFYGFPVSEETITFHKKSWNIPLLFEGVKIFRGGEVSTWKIQ